MPETKIVKNLKFPGSQDTYQINATQLSGYTITQLLDAVDGLQFKGELSTSYTPIADCGHVYVVTSNVVINGDQYRVGDMLICNKDDTAAANSTNVEEIKKNWIGVQRNIDEATEAVPGIVKLGAEGGAEKFGVARSLVDSITTDTVKAGSETWWFDCGTSSICVEDLMA